MRAWAGPTCSGGVAASPRTFLAPLDRPVYPVIFIDLCT